MRVERGFFDEQRSMRRGGELVSAEVTYFVFDCATEEQGALDAVRASAPTRIQNLLLSVVEIDERLAEQIYKVRCTYESDNSSDDSQGENDAKFAFDTGGATMHRNYSLQTVSKVPNNAPNFRGAIEVDSEGNVNGVDITMSSMEFTETHSFTNARMTTAYKKKVAYLTGKVNNSGFRGYAPGEVLFLGASGARNGEQADDMWEITYRFAVSPNRANITVGNLTVASKDGWDYMWVRYLDSTNASRTAIEKKAVGAYVERVYERANFGELGI